MCTGVFSGWCMGVSLVSFTIKFTNEKYKRPTSTSFLTLNMSTPLKRPLSESPSQTKVAGTPPPKLMPSIVQVSRPFFTSSELSYLHSFTIPDHKKIGYNQRKHQIFQYIFQICKSLKLPLRVLNTTMNYYQRYYLFNKFEEMNEESEIVEENDPFIVSLACLFLASKNEDCIKKLRDILIISNKLRDLDESTINIDHQRKIIMNLEFKLLQIIKFDFINGSNNIPSPDQLVITFSKKLGLDYKSSMFSWLITFDIMSTPLCLIIPPHCIALAIIIVTLNLKPKHLSTKYNKVEDENTDYQDNLIKILEKIDSFKDFKCPEPLVNEGIIYILDYYIHQMNFSILNDYIPSIDPELGKEQIFKFMDLKSRFNDLKILNEASTNKPLLQQDFYLKKWDYSIGLKGSVRFMLGNKRRRFDQEFDLNESKPKS